MNSTKKYFLILFSLMVSAEFTIAQHHNDPANATEVSPLLIGEVVPSINLMDSKGKMMNLSEVVATKAAVLIFYRGGWCPYCNLHLGELQQIEDEIIEKGYQIIAISPDAPVHIQETIEKQDLKYALFSDPDLAVTRAFGLAFQAPGRNVDMLKLRSEGKNPGVLPVPAVFVVNQEGKILFEYISPDYKTRISGKMLLAVLDSLEP
jgi:peroxiredoxin